MTGWALATQWMAVTGFLAGMGVMWRVLHVESKKYERQGE